MIPDNPTENVSFGAIPEIHADVLNWLAWAPSLPEKADWLAWAESSSEALPSLPEQSKEKFSTAPGMKFLPLALRKRLSVTTKISLFLAHTLLKDQHARENITTIFSSRHGEGEFTQGLLRSITEEAPLSPMAFSRSVHNTASGIFGIAEKNHMSSTAISSHESSFNMGLIAAVAHLSRYDEVLFVMADDVIPDDFAQFVDEPWGAYGIALHLKRGETALSLPHGTKALPEGLVFLREYLTK